MWVGCLSEDLCWPVRGKELPGRFSPVLYPPSEEFVGGTDVRAVLIVEPSTCLVPVRSFLVGVDS